MIPFTILPGIMVRAPYYRWKDYDLSRLPVVLADVAFRQALFLASGDFYALLEKKGFDWGSLNDRERHTLAKYYNRMSFRAVPFGAFSSFGLARLPEGGSALEAGSILHLFPDGLGRKALPRPLPLDTLLVLNPTVYKIGTYFRYVFTDFAKQGGHNFRLDAIDASRFNRELLLLFEKGARSVGALQQWVKQRADCEDAEAEDYVFFLVEEQVLYSTQQGFIIGAVSGSSVPFGKEVRGDKPYYAALERHAGGAVAGKPDLERAVAALRKLVPVYANTELEYFIQTFKKRFDRRRVPLLEALDPDAGIDYAGQHPLINSLISDLPVGVTTSRPVQLTWQAVHQLLLRKWTGDMQPVCLTDADLDALPEPAAPLPPGMGLMFRHTTAGPLIDYAAGVSSLQLSGRFSLFSKELFEHGREMAVAEQAANPGVVFADVGLLSDDHVDNINRRLSFYEYEIPLNVFSILPPAQQLAPQDLLLSVQGNELVLESKRLGKRIIPRLSTAFNFRRCELPVFRLLCDLQYQGVQGNLAFEPERLFPGLPSYPRVTVNGVIISLAKWHLRTADLDLESLPRYITLGATDQQLVFNLSDPMERAFFLEEIRKQKQLTVQEYLPSSGEYAAQYVSCIHNPAVVYKSLQPAAVKTKVRRSFALGSDWLYLKLYCSPPTADTVIARVIAPLVRRHHAGIRNWFFIRYEEDGGHLRLRIRASNGDVGPLLIAVRGLLRANRLETSVRDVQGDTYHREVERYGAAYIEMVENVFRQGSELVTTLYEKNDGRPGEEKLFAAALQCAAQISKAFFPKVSEQLALSKNVTDSFIAEFGDTKVLRQSLDLKYRSLREQVSGSLGKDVGHSDDFLGAVTVLVNAVKAKHPNVRSALAADLIHMQVNRIFNTGQRKNEMLVYHCLYKHLRTKQALTAALT